ncbi:MAG: ARPP-1 family domain-containing protein [Ilumatobacteraceae bacterium]
MDLKIAVGEPVVRGALALFPLTTTQGPAPEYLPGPVAEAVKAFVVQERDGGATVPELVVQNLGGAPVLLIEGETLLGSKQNRTLNLSVLCAPATSTTIPVSCVEAGRWGAPQASRRSPRHSPQAMRRAKVASTLDAAAQGAGARSDQGRVWADVDEYASAFAAPSATSSLEDVFDVAEPQTRLLIDDLEPGVDQQGVLVAIGGEVRGVDLFDKPSTLSAYWSGLLAGYALDAVGRSDKGPELAAAADFADRIGAAAVVAFDAPGLGEAGRLVGPGVFGAQKSWAGTVVHLAAFVDDETTRSTRPILRTSRRVRRT